MSEENQEVSIGFIGDNSKVEIEFSDGVFKIPQSIVLEFGAEKFAQLAPKLKQKTYGEFMGAFRLLMQKKQVNEFGRDVIGNHLAKNFQIY